MIHFILSAMPLMLLLMVIQVVAEFLRRLETNDIDPYVHAARKVVPNQVFVACGSLQDQLLEQTQNVKVASINASRSLKQTAFESVVAAKVKMQVQA